MVRIAVLVSGRGSNLKAIHTHVEAGNINAAIALVASNDPAAPAVAAARAAGIPVWAQNHTAFPSREVFDAAMLEVLEKAAVDAVVLAGYMRLLSGDFIRAYKGRIVNVHPSLLPAFPGISGGKDAVDYGVKIAGCSVHFVEEAVDAGPVIIQAATCVGEVDGGVTLMDRIHALEHRIYPQAVAWLAANRLSIDGRTVRLASTVTEYAEPSPDALIYPPLEKGF